MEVSPRVPGTMGLSRNMGINFPLLTLFDRWGYDIDIIDNEYEIMLDRAFYSAYKIEYEYEHVYVDYDDTLVIDGCVTYPWAGPMSVTLNAKLIAPSPSQGKETSLGQADGAEPHSPTMDTSEMWL